MIIGARRTGGEGEGATLSDVRLRMKGIRRNMKHDCIFVVVPLGCIFRRVSLTLSA